MSALSDLKSLTPQQRNAVIASFLGWMLDAFDFFILVFVLKYIAEEFGTDVTSVTIAITLTLAMRPIGALLFGYLAERFGRRPILMINVLAYALLEFLSGFAPSLTALIVLRALFGIAMGGEWGVGAALTMETIPPKLRGLISGLLQAGYPAGYLIASLVFFLLFPIIGWRGMFMLGALPALLVLYIRSYVEESPVFLARKREKLSIGRIWTILRQHAGLAIYAVLLMTAFNFFSHGTQDLYPTFLEVQKKLSTDTVGTIAIIYNIGAILGGITFGIFSERIGRRRAMVIAALLALPVIPLWVYSSTPALLAAGAFLMQFAVQGAWGVVPAHLNELSPDELRSTFPGLTYQLGNLIASANATFQAGLAEHYGNDYAFALAAVIAVVAVLVALLAGFGTEAKGVVFGRAPRTGASGRRKN
ncbi:MFS transporter [Brucella sp. IR073]|uniref:MFS transporter n=1 Tax=unclassified Brucella TaxID=2632610 RepID=UPI003B98473E